MMAISAEERVRPLHIVNGRIVTASEDPAVVTTIPPSTRVYLNIATLGTLQRGGMTLVAKGTGLPYLNAFSAAVRAHGDLKADFFLAGRLDAAVEMGVVLETQVLGSPVAEVVLLSEASGSQREVSFSFPSTFLGDTAPFAFDLAVLAETDSAGSVDFSPTGGRTNLRKLNL